MCEKVAIYTQKLVYASFGQCSFNSTKKSQHSSFEMPPCQVSNTQLKIKSMEALDCKRPESTMDDFQLQVSKK